MTDRKLFNTAINTRLPMTIAPDGTRLFPVSSTFGPDTVVYNNPGDTGPGKDNELAACSKQ